MDHKRFDDMDNDHFNNHIDMTDEKATESPDGNIAGSRKKRSSFWSRFEDDDFENDVDEDIPDRDDSDDEWDGDVWENDFLDSSEDSEKNDSISVPGIKKLKIVPFWKKEGRDGEEIEANDEQVDDIDEADEVDEHKQSLIRRFIGFVQENVREHKVLTVGGLVAIVLILLVLWLMFRTFHDYTVISSVDRKTDTISEYYFREDGTVTYSKDGISFENLAGEVQWDQVLDLTSPKLVGCEDYFAVGDIDANAIFVFNGQGMQGQITLEKPLVDLKVSRQGVVSAILADDAMNRINMYDKSGKLLVGINATIATTGYPLAMALSPDGTRLVVSYAVFGGDRLKNQIIFYDFSNESSSSTPSGIVTSRQLIPKLEFTDNQTVLACGENSFMTYRFDETVTELNSQQFDQKVRSLFVTNDSIGIITRNTKEPKNEKDQVDRYVVTLYHLTGGQYASFTFDDDYKTVTASEEEMILCSDRKCVMYTFNGHRKFDYTFDEEIVSVTPAMVSGRYILINNETMQMISLR